MTALLPASSNGLTEKQIAFVHWYVELGGRDASRAAELAGYSTQAEGHRVIAHRLLRMPKMLAAIRHEVETKVKAGAALAMSQLLHLAEHGAPDSVRLAASQAVLDRAGLLVSKTSSHHVVVEDRRSTAELVARIREMAGRLGLDPKKLLGQRDIETEAIEVVQDDDDM